jgi:hypothetical protein
MHTYAATFGVLALSISSCLSAADARFLGLTIPDQPEPFTPAILEGLSPLVATNPAFSPDFRRFVFTTARFDAAGKLSELALYESRFDGKRWGAPKRATDLGGEGVNSAEPAFSGDGRWLYFTSNRPPGSPPWNVKIFRAAVTTTGFEGVTPVDIDVPEKAGTFYPQFQADGTLMLTSDGLGGEGGGDVWQAPRKPGGGFEAPKRVGGDFNTPQNDWDLVESADGRVRVWASAREGGAGRVDIWFSVKEGNGQWSAARNLSAVNTPATETAPRFSPDGSVLFFHRTVNGVERIFWADLSILGRGD